MGLWEAQHPILVRILVRALAWSSRPNKSYYVRHHRRLSYKVGDWVWLRVRQRIPPSSLPPSTTNKVNPRYYGPYQAIEVINEVVVRLRLLPGARIHDVFHIGLLKIFRGQPPNAAPPLPPMHHGAAVPVPAAAVKARLARGVRQILIQWQGQPPLAATWEDIDDFVQRYPKFQLEDDLLIEGGRDVMWGKRYSCKPRIRDRSGQRPPGRSSGISHRV